jgi:hypothetical protein
MNQHIIKHHLLARAALAVLIGLLVLAFGYADLAEGANKSRPDREDAIQAFNRDVYWLDRSTLRNPTADTPPDAPLYSVVGAALGVTWGEWQSASATAKAHHVGGPARPSTHVRIRLSGLIPGGVYSVFYGTFGPDSEHPLCPGVERTLPLEPRNPNQSPDPSSFVADADGEARFHARVDGRLLDATQVFYSVVYHLDGRTYHPFPNRGEYFTQGENCRSTFGEDAMRQLVVFQKF